MTGTRATRSMLSEPKTRIMRAVLADFSPPHPWREAYGRDVLVGRSSAGRSLPARIERCREHDHRALDDHLDLDRHAKQQHLVGDDDDHGRTRERAEDRSAAALQRHLADHAGDDGIELVAL